MPAIGPQLPPHLAKRKRTLDADANDAPPKHPRRDTPSKSAPVIGPANRDEIGLDDSDAESPPPRRSQPAAASDHGPAPPASTSGPRGPSPPPAANHDEIHLSDSDPGPQPSDSDSDSDDYGPAPPSASASRPAAPIGPSLPAAQPGPQRDAWMLAPPPPGSVFAERDPTRIRSRKFASKPSSAGPSAGPSIWTETPEEKLRRLRDSVLGRADPDPAPADPGQRSAKQLERDRRIAASVDARRGASLYEEHSRRCRGEAAAKTGDEDDPSKRAFDRDKDMALGGKIGTAQKRELISKSANFGGRFQKGSYL